MKSHQENGSPSVFLFLSPFCFFIWEVGANIDMNEVIAQEEESHEKDEKAMQVISFERIKDSLKRNRNSE
jgi:Na+-transporting methylmalonyl-CoA/oxaloacetate decarboxylase gamma subunit